MIRLALLLLCLSSPAWATRDAWPALYDVTGVRETDMLNVRTRPEAGAPIIGGFAPDRTGVEVMRPNDRETWGLVNVAEGTGWVSLRFLARQPGQWEGAPPAIRSCFGTEPFWTLTIDGDDAQLSTLEDTTGTWRVIERRSSVNRLDVHAIRFETGATDMQAVIRNQACNDGMSDRAYGLEVDLLTGDLLRSGCCSLAE